jgi:Fe-S cluster biogenesis protein NfuA
MTNSEYKSLFSRVEEALDEVRPHLAVDGGNVELIEITDDLTVKVKWIGSCEFCSMSSMTMKAGVQETVKNKVPEIDHVIAINGVHV